MKKQRSDALKTRLNLLEAAGEVFAKKGFWNATHEEICSRADANTAAINYHFVSKENLYVEAWKFSFEKSVMKYPVERYVSPDDPPEKRLRGWVLSFLLRIGDPEGNEVNIMFKEMANPTGLLKDVIVKTNEPIDRGLRSLLSELIGKGADEDMIGFCHMSFLSLIFGPMLHLRSTSGAVPIPGSDHPLNLDVEKLADYVVKFVLAGIRSFSKTRK
jgi:TetR/AcrR family transcriptional regulator, regulator of cefoperazone and chloramphenicol sensitivity